MARSLKYTESVVMCRHCQNRAKMRIVAEFDDLSADEMGYNSGSYWEVLYCDACQKVTLQTGGWEDSMMPEDFEWRTVFPEPDDAIEGLPENIRKAHEAAQRVARIDANAYAVLLGRVLELVCLDKDGQGKTLAGKIKDLAAKAIIPGALGDMADKMRGFRNVGAHAELGALGPKEIPVLSQLCEAILEYVYVAPQLVDRAKSMLDRLGR